MHIGECCFKFYKYNSLREAHIISIHFSDRKSKLIKIKKKKNVTLYNWGLQEKEYTVLFSKKIKA